MFISVVLSDNFIIIAWKMDFVDCSDYNCRKGTKAERFGEFPDRGGEYNIRFCQEQAIGIISKEIVCGGMQEWTDIGMEECVPGKV